MDQDALLRELKSLAEKMDIRVNERVLKKRPIRVRSGLCLVRGKPHLIIDRKLPKKEKIAVYIEAISGLPHDDVYIMPYIRDLLADYAAEHGQKPLPFDEIGKPEKAADPDESDDQVP